MFIQSALETHRHMHPDFALGVAMARGNAAPTVLTDGPLWTGATDQVTDSSVWHIGSITKSLTATLVLQQVDSGALTLDAPIGPYLPQGEDIDPTWRALTLEQILSHTGGLMANASRRQFRQYGTLPSVQGRHRVLSELWSTRLGPTGPHLYSNVGYMLAGYVLEQVLSQPWETLVQTRIGGPLGLDSLGFGAPKSAIDPKGHRPTFFGQRIVAREDIHADNPAWMGPAGTVHMSLADMITYGRAHLGHGAQILSPQARAPMQTPVRNDYGLGWVMQNGTVWHNGSNTMWYAILILDPATDTVVAVTQNTAKTAADIDALARGLIDRIRSE